MVFPASPPSTGLLNKTGRWFLLHPYVGLALIVFAAFGPFLAKPFNIDDPLFIWVAHQIHANPGNPYGFDLNWTGITQPMWEVTENPPLACYYLALAAGIFGWSEIALHFAFLFPALAAVWGTYRLAGYFCRQPLVAALATLFTPVFLLSGTTVMCDMLLLACWVWAAVLWVEGIQRDNFWQLIGAGVLMATALLTKYFGLCLVPLLFAYGLIYRRRAGRWIVPLLIPLLALCIYQLVMRTLYGHALFSAAADYAAHSRTAYNFPRLITFLTAMTFTGGCLAVVVFFAPLLWNWRVLAWVALPVICFATLCIYKGAMLEKFGSFHGLTRAILEIQIFFWAIGGALVLSLAIEDIWQRRDTGSWFLMLWIMGTFVFTAFLNWAVNGRSLLPMAPAVGILLARRLEQNISITSKHWWPWNAAFCFAGSAALALMVTQSDFLLATAVRHNVQNICKRYGHTAHTLWFEGHWGFQYYMAAAGASALDFKNSKVKAGDVVAIPANNVNLLALDSKRTVNLETFTASGPQFLATMNDAVGAGFHSSVWGPLPFAFGRVPPDKVAVYVLGPTEP